MTSYAEKTEFWVVGITDPITGTITKVKRSEYLEFKEMNLNYNLDKNWYTKGERIKSLYPDIKMPKTIPDYPINFRILYIN